MTRTLSFVAFSLGLTTMSVAASSRQGNPASAGAASREAAARLFIDALERGDLEAYTARIAPDVISKYERFARDILLKSGMGDQDQKALSRSNPEFMNTLIERLIGFEAIPQGVLSDKSEKADVIGPVIECPGPKGLSRLDRAGFH